MALKCNLIIDSCSDLPLELIQGQEGVSIMNFTYILDGVDTPDDFFQTRSVEEFYGLMRAGSQPTTSQVPPAVIENTFRDCAATGLDTVYLSMSSAISSNYSSACMLADKVMKDFPLVKIHVIDTLNASSGEGVLCLEALKHQKEGWSADQLVEWANEFRYKADFSFMVDSLDSLHRGGRVPGSVAVIGGALNIKPMLGFDLQGSLTLTGGVRGRKKGYRALAAFIDEHMDADRTQIVVGHADCAGDIDAFKAEVLKVKPDAEFVVHNIGTTIGAHVGPGTITVGFIGTDRREIAAAKAEKKGLFGRKK